MRCDGSGNLYAVVCAVSRVVVLETPTNTSAFTSVPALSSGTRHESRSEGSGMGRGNASENEMKATMSMSFRQRR
jgi:hypothetical protein